MSATLELSSFLSNTLLFPTPPPVLTLPSRQFPVSIYYNKRTDPDYLGAALKKCKKIHKNLPFGDVLVFLTGEKEIKEFCWRLEAELRREEEEGEEGEEEEEMEEEREEGGGEGKNDKEKVDGGNKKEDGKKEEERIEEESEKEKEKMEEEEKREEEEEGRKKIVINREEEAKRREIPKKILILPLYSKLSSIEQTRIFASHDMNTRVFIISTNVAETSLTLPGIKYVVDSGKEKKKIFDPLLHIPSYVISFTSQASASQRTGRAGRVGPGFCYRLYSPAVFSNVFAKHSIPEIVGYPLETVVLRLRLLGVRDVMGFPLPSKPEEGRMRKAEEFLVRIGAIERGGRGGRGGVGRGGGGEEGGGVTELGRVLDSLGVECGRGKMMLEGRRRGVGGWSLLGVCSIGMEGLIKEEKGEEGRGEMEAGGKKEEGDWFDEEEDDVKKEIEDIKREKERIAAKRKEFLMKVRGYKIRYKDFYNSRSDLLFLINLIGRFFEHMEEECKAEGEEGIGRRVDFFCHEYNLNSKVLREIYENFYQVRGILLTLINSEEEKKGLLNFFKPYVFPNEAQQNNLIEIFVENLVEKVARKVSYMDEENRMRKAYELEENNEKAFIHPTSFLFNEQPDFICYADIFKTKKLYLKFITKIDDLSLLNALDPTPNRKIELLKDPEPFYSQKKDKIIVFANSHFGPKLWPLDCFQHHFEEEALEQYYWFAQNLLSGRIFKFFEAMIKVYSKNTKTIKINNISPEVQRLVNKLRGREVNRKKQLEEIWKKEPK